MKTFALCSYLCYCKPICYFQYQSILYLSKLFSFCFSFHYIYIYTYIYGNHKKISLIHSESSQGSQGSLYNFFIIYNLISIIYNIYIDRQIDRQIHRYIDIQIYRDISLVMILSLLRYVFLPCLFFLSILSCQYHLSICLYYLPILMYLTLLRCYYTTIHITAILLSHDMYLPIYTLTYKHNNIQT